MADVVLLKHMDFLGGESFADIPKGKYGIFYLEYGAGEVNINGKTDTVKEGTFSIVSSDDSFAFVASGISSAVCISFDIGPFSTPKLLPLLEIFRVKDRLRYYNVENGKEICRYISDMEELAENSPFYSQLLFAKLIELLCHLNTEEYKSKSENTRADKISAKVINYINENLERSFDLSDIAGSLYMSKYYMSHMFKKETGISVGEMVFIKKMEHADILLSSGVPAQRVSELCGFNSYSAFFRIYKRIKGHSPQTKLSEKRGRAK